MFCHLAVVVCLLTGYSVYNQIEMLFAATLLICRYIIPYMEQNCVFFAL